MIRTARITEMAELSLDKIRTDGGTQMRATISMDVVTDYKEAWLEEAEFPPVVVFHDGAEHWLADGFHRFYGAREAGLFSIPCEIKKGTVRDAKFYAASANVLNGLRRTNDDKRAAVSLLLEDGDWSKMSDRAIAKHCGVHHDTVSSYRNQLSESDSCNNGEDTKPAQTTGLDGKKRRRPPRAAESTPSKQVAPPAKANGKASPRSSSAEAKDAGVAGKPAEAETCPVCNGDGFYLPTAVMPECLAASEEFVEMWGEWMLYRIKIRKKLTTITIKKQFKRLAGMGAKEATAALFRTMEKGWTGIWTESEKVNPRASGMDYGP
jgi:transposase-like protein